jgi:alpha-tubulin suppressor-like RCC1 family protein
MRSHAERGRNFIQRRGYIWTRHRLPRVPVRAIPNSALGHGSLFHSCGSARMRNAWQMRTFVPWAVALVLSGCTSTDDATDTGLPRPDGAFADGAFFSEAASGGSGSAGSSESSGGPAGASSSSSGSVSSSGSSSSGSSSSIDSAKLVARSVNASQDGVCAVLNDGSIRCWGDTAFYSSSSAPVPVPDIVDAVSVAVGMDLFACVVLGSGAVQCWGYNTYGDLGNGTTESSSVPVTVVGITNAIAVAAGDGPVCAVLATGAVQCWGVYLGNGTTASSSVPVTVAGITNAVGVAAGTAFACAVLNDGSIRCWGDDTFGELGDGMSTSVGSTSPSRYVPVEVSEITNAIAVAASDGFACAVLSSGAVQCWGGTGITNGALGDSQWIDSFVPVTVTGITNAVGIAAGSWFACAVLKSGAVECWGVNTSGQLGNGTTTASLVPVEVTGIANAVAVTAGYSTACAELSSGSVQCWGGYSLGNGAGLSSSVPVTVSGF